MGIMVYSVLWVMHGFISSARSITKARVHPATLLPASDIMLPTTALAFGGKRIREFATLGALGLLGAKRSQSSGPAIRMPVRSLLLGESTDCQPTFKGTHPKANFDQQQLPTSTTITTRDIREN